MRLRDYRCQALPVEERPTNASGHSWTLDSDHRVVCNYCGRFFRVPKEVA